VICTKINTATYGYAKQYSGVNLGSYVKHITSSNLTAQGLRNVGGAVMQLAKVEELEAHRRAVSIRLDWMDKAGTAVKY
jgi:phosphoribosyl-ATP pyrophosphohydrolase/phosphoribosyl-AMP cyclohydrolase/histidinol dehydrogenase